MLVYLIFISYLYLSYIYLNIYTVSNELTPYRTGSRQTRTVLGTWRHIITPRFMQRIHFIAFLDRILHCIADAWRCQYHIHRGLSQRVLGVLDSELSLKLAELAAAALLKAQSFEPGC